MQVYSKKEIVENLSPKVCLHLMRQCFEDLGNGQIAMSPKHAAHLPIKNSLLGTMTGHELNGPYAMAKLIGLFPNNKKTSSHQGLIALFDQIKGEMLSVFEASSITALRTAATAALATKYLSNKNADTLSLIGAGEQSFHQAIAVSKIRTIENINIFNRTPANAEKLKNDLLAQGLNTSINTYGLDQIKAISKDYDIISVSTSSAQPLLRINDLPRTCHINSIGACSPKLVEVDSDIINNCQLVIDNYEVSCLEAGNLINTKDKTFTQNMIELKNLIGKDKKRNHSITLFNSTGLGIQDLYCAIYLYNQKNDFGDNNV